VLAAPRPILIDEWQHLPPIWDKLRRAADDGATPVHRGQRRELTLFIARLPATDAG
jgi:hypothetical protein